MNGEDYTIKANALQLGLLSGLIITADDTTQQLLKLVLGQIVDIKKQLELDARVKKQIIPGGMLKLSDKDGNVIIREPYPWEVGGN